MAHGANPKLVGKDLMGLKDLDGKLLHPISQGEWGFDDVLAVDEKAGRVYVSSNRDAVIDKQTYALALDGSTADRPPATPAQTMAVSSASLLRDR